MVGTLRHLALVFVLASLAPACSSDSAPSDDLTKSEAAAQAGKTDLGEDLCALRQWYGDGECDSFCEQPDPDCAAASPADDGAYWAASCQLNQGWDDLAQLTILEEATLTPGSGLTPIQRQQLVIGADVASPEEAFEYTDDNEFAWFALGPPDGEATLVLYRYYAGDTEVGFVFEPQGAELLSSIEDGWFTAPCAGNLIAPEDAVRPEAPGPWRLECFFNDDGLDLLRLEVGPETRVRQSDVEDDLLARQLMVGTETNTLDDAFASSDDEDFAMREMSDPASDDRFRLFRFYAGDTLVGFVTPIDADEVKGTIEDGELYDCSLVFRP